MTRTRYYTIPTPAGGLLAWSNGRREDGTYSVGVRTEHEHNRYPHDAPAGGWDAVAFTMRFCRVDYYAHEHYAHDPDSGDLVPTMGRTTPLRRADAFSDGTDAAVRAFRAAVEPAILSWLATDDGRAMLAAGERERVDRERRRLLRERAELADQLAAVQTALDSLPAE